METDFQREDLTARKRALRGVVLARRDAMSAVERADASQGMTRSLLALPEYQRARTVMSYISFGTEVETLEFFAAVRRDNKTMVLPRVDAVDKSLSLHRVENLEQLAAGVWGIREPRVDLPLMPIADVDLVLMPGVAFDRRGNRLGYGAGYYDRLLAGAPADLTRVTMLFNCQLVDEVPSGPHDQKVQILITPNEQWRIS